MQRITTIAEARALVGRTFERDRKLITVVGFGDLRMSGVCDGIVIGDVYCRGPDKRVEAIWLPNVNDWLAGATEIVQ